MLQQSEKPPPDHPLLSLPHDDLNLITRFVLESGSLKALAKAYDVSYPTIRTRLDRTIHRLNNAINNTPNDPLREHLASLVERGQLSPHDAERVINLADQRSNTNTTAQHQPKNHGAAT